MVKSGPIARTFDEVFEIIKVNSIKVGECNLWQGRTAGQGYGVICFEGKQVYIHRLIHLKFKGDCNVIRHTCDKPNCWSPKHLVSGTHNDNVQDKVVKGRHCFGSNHYSAKVTEDIVREIRASGLSLMEVVRKYNLTRGCAYAIITGATWKHVIQTRSSDKYFEIDSKTIRWKV